MPDVGDSTRVRDLIPPPRQPGQLPTRRDQRRTPPTFPAAPVRPSDDADDRPLIDEYV